ncbi:hypothetical protein TMPK1_06920 [Rhodospirillales bacterium TMPK1]|uniref:Uncharacterized protein n=1 Tax=Roseiterribacter gracilis TaxID=2812848 RepID=A0A8S8XAW8_9PROT|nr:hypothetical protein TMPK1_06920 [Rhodospirillales bacterium TMPK1]
MILLIASLAALIVPGAQHGAVDGYTATRRIEVCITRSTFIALLPLAGALAIDMAVALSRTNSTMFALASGVAFGALALWFWYGLAFRDRARYGAAARKIAAGRQEEGTPMSEKITYMLTEARTNLPGVQAMLGFQLAVIVTQGFDALPPYARWLHLAALGLMALAIILLMAPAVYHRTVYAGENSAQFLALGGRMVFAATIPLALGLAADCCVAVEKILHATDLAVACGVVVLLGLTALWHIVPLWMRPR